MEPDSRLSLFVVSRTSASFNTAVTCPLAPHRASLKNQGARVTQTLSTIHTNMLLLAAPASFSIFRHAAPTYPLLQRLPASRAILCEGGLLNQTAIREVFVLAD